MAQKLTRKKRRYVEQFKPEKINGTPLQYDLSIQNKYVKAMQALFNEVAKETEKTVLGIYKTPEAKKYFASGEDASISSSARITMNQLIDRIMKRVKKKARTMADRMVNAENDASKSALYVSLKQLSGGLSIKTNIDTGDIQDVFKASIAENVDLIVTMTGNYLESVNGAVNRSIQTGGGLQTLIPEIQKHLNDKYKTHLNKAKNVALDQTRKAYNGLNAARLKKLGMESYEWIHSGGGQRPRPHHIQNYPAGLNHGIFKLSEPPIVEEKTGARGIPGTAINCRCVMRPLILFDEVDHR